MTQSNQNKRQSALNPTQEETPLRDLKLASTNDKKRIRQDRYTNDEVKFHLRSQDKLFEIINYSSFGLAIFHQEPLPQNLSWTTCAMEVEGHNITSIDLKLVRREPLPAGGFKTGFEIISEPIRIEKIAIIPELWRSLEDIRTQDREIQKIVFTIREPVYHIKSTLDKYKNFVDSLSDNRTYQSNQHLTDVESTVINLVVSDFFKVIPKFFKEFHKVLENKSPEEVKAAFKFFRDETHSLFYHSPFVSRTLEKPLGYAGDFEMMNLIYRNESVGESLFHKCIEKFFLLQPEPHAVRNRVDFLLSKIGQNISKANADDKVVILSVASGPAMEIQKMIEVLDQKALDKVEIHLLDQDILSLKHAQRQIKQLERTYNKKLNVELINLSIKKVISSGLEYSGGYDLIYSAGLFDYFNDEVVRIAGKTLLSSVKKGGQLIIGNFDVSTPSAFPMSLMWDWNLIYRSKSDLEPMLAT